MKKIGFIGAVDKIDLILYVAKLLEETKKKVLVVDATILQKAKYIVPAIFPTKSYVTDFNGIDVAVGFDGLDDIENYINDTERGHVWEEILILLPENIGLIMLSATIPNYLDFAKWIGSIKKATIYIEITYKRVVPLEHNIYVNTKNVFKIMNTSENSGKVNHDMVYKALKCADEENKKMYSKKADYGSREKRKQRQQKIIDQIQNQISKNLNLYNMHKNIYLISLLIGLIHL